MGMLNLHGYRLSELQQMFHLLMQAEAGEITDVRFVRAEIFAHIQARARSLRLKSAKLKGEKIKTIRCPECGAPMVPVATGGEDIKILGCRKCRYSKMVE